MRNLTILLAVACLCVAGTAQGITVSYDDTNVGGALWSRPVGLGPTISSLGPVSYHNMPFSVDITGLYDITSVQNYDGYLHLYHDTFEADNQLDGLIAANDDGWGWIGTSELLDTELIEGETYFLVTSAYSSSGEGTFTNTFEGIGTVTLGFPQGGPDDEARAVPEPITMVAILAGMGSVASYTKKRKTA